MSDINLKKKYKSFTSNPLVSQGSKALEQCLAPVMDSAKLLKVVSNKFNDKGRPEHIVEWTNVDCVITPNGSTSKGTSKDGVRSTTKYNVLYMSSLKLQIGDVLKHEVFGDLKITEFDGYSPLGLTTATATKLGAGWDIVDGDAVRLKQPEIN